MYFHQGGMFGVVSHDRAKPQYIQLALHVGKELLYSSSGAAISANAPDATRIIPTRLISHLLPSSVISSSLAEAEMPTIIHAGTVAAHVHQLGGVPGPTVKIVSSASAAIVVPMMADLCLLEIIW